MIKKCIKNFMKKIFYPNCYSSEVYVQYLRTKGAKIGDGTFFYTPERRPVDESSLPFLEIGKNCRITQDAYILLHDYSYAVLRSTHHEMLLKSACTKIGNNVFIGTRALILMNTTIGDNVIVGAGSVVSGNFGSNIVIAGNPAKIVCTIEEYYEKLKSRFDKSAKIYYQQMSNYYGRALEESEMDWFVTLWNSEDKDARRKILSTHRIDGDDKSKVIDDVMNVKPQYSSYEAFLNSFEHKY